MTHPGDHRSREPRERADERLVVEWPEILRRATAARDDHHVEVAELGEAVERPDERLDRSDCPAPARARRSARLRGSRRAMTGWMSCQTAPIGLVTTRCAAGQGGAGACGRGEETFRGEAALERFDSQIGVAGAGRP